jgi:hypothetical protein
MPSPDMRKGTIIIVRDGFVIDGMVDFGHGRKYKFHEALREADRIIDSYRRTYSGYQYNRKCVFDDEFEKAIKSYDRAVFTDQLVNQDADEWRKRIMERNDATT